MFDRETNPTACLLRGASVPAMSVSRDFKGSAAQVQGVGAMYRQISSSLRSLGASSLGAFHTWNRA